MRNDPSIPFSCFVAEDHQPVFVEVRRRSRRDDQTRPYRGLTLRQMLGRDPIELGVVEARILRFLARRPYRPFTREKIASAVSSSRYPVTEDCVDAYIKSLRDQLGFFHDYIQTVRFQGYRFKA